MGKKYLCDLEVKGYIDVDGGIKDANGDLGNSGQYLQTNGSDVVWANAPGASVTKVSKYVMWNYALGSDAGVTFQNTSAGDATNTCTITHNLGTYYIMVSVSDNYGWVTDNTQDFVDLGFALVAKAPTINTIKLYWSDDTPPDNNQTFNVTIMG